MPLSPAVAKTTRLPIPAKALHPTPKARLLRQALIPIFHCTTEPCWGQASPATTQEEVPGSFVHSRRAVPTDTC